MVTGVGDGLGFAEEILRFVGVEGDPRPGRIYGGVDSDVSHMHSLRPKIPRQRLREDSWAAFVGAKTA